MITDSYKDLKKGDRVKFEDVYVHDNLRISGSGVVIGFGEFGRTVIVWIKLDGGGKRGIAYEYVQKAAPAG